MLGKYRESERRSEVGFWTLTSQLRAEVEALKLGTCEHPAEGSIPPPCMPSNVMIWARRELKPLKPVGLSPLSAYVRLWLCQAHDSVQPNRSSPTSWSFQPCFLDVPLFQFSNGSFFIVSKLDPCQEICRQHLEPNQSNYGHCIMRNVLCNVMPRAEPRGSFTFLVAKFGLMLPLFLSNRVWHRSVWMRNGEILQHRENCDLEPIIQNQH